MSAADRLFTYPNNEALLASFAEQERQPTFEERGLKLLALLKRWEKKDNINKKDHNAIQLALRTPLLRALWPTVHKEQLDRMSDLIYFYSKDKNRDLVLNTLRILHNRLKHIDPDDQEQRKHIPLARERSRSPTLRYMVRGLRERALAIPIAKERVFTTPNLEMYTLRVDPGEELGVETHAPNITQAFVVLAGSGEAMVGGKSGTRYYPVREGDVFWVPPLRPHNVRVPRDARESLVMYTFYSGTNH
jgi:mannose-6-phosphate isomerase-like protein (cupin superfamily)